MRGSLIPTQPADYEEAAVLYRTCRRRGETVRKLIDCLIAATAMRAAIPILHADNDFEVLARHTPLSIARPESRLGLELLRGNTGSMSVCVKSSPL